MKNSKTVKGKANETARQVLNKKLEKYLEDATKLFDKIFETNDKLMKENLPPLGRISEFLQKGTAIEHEYDISEEIKAKFLYRLVREYRRHIENQRQMRLK